jgi:two-component system cell cycle sensor histidine kinase/response regulator CckA
MKWNGLRPISVRLQSKLILLTLMVLVPAVGLVVWDQVAERRSGREHAVQDMLRLGRLAAGQQATLLDGVQRLLSTLAEVAEIRSSDAVRCSALLAAVLHEHPTYLNLWVSNADGSRFCEAAEVASRLSGLGRPWFERVMATGAPSAGDFQLSLMNQRPDLVVAQPVFDASRSVTRVVAAAIELDQMDAIFAQAELPAGATLTLTDRRSTILARAPLASSAVGQLAARPVRANRIVDAGELEVVSGTDAAGQPRLYTIAAVKAATLDTGLTVTMSMASSTVFESADRLLRRHLWLLVIVACLAIGGALFGGHLFVLRPIAELQSVTGAIADGRLDARFQLAAGVPGLSDLGRAVNSMAASLQAREREKDDGEAQRGLLAAIVENAQDAIISHTIEGVILTWNAGAEHLFGFTAAEAIGRSLEIIVPGDRAGELRANLAQQRHGGRAALHGTSRRRKDGSLVPVSINVSPVKDRFGQTIGGAGIVRDISDLVDAEKARREAEERMRFALEVSNVGVWEHHGGNDRVFWSDTLARLHGLTLDTFGGRLDDFLACVHPDERDSVSGAIGKAIVTHQRKLTVEYRAVWKDRTEHRLTTTAHYAYDAEGGLVRGAGVTVDVTEQRSLEARLRQAQKMEAVGRLAGGIAHDYNNMLNVIMGYGELVLDGLRADERHHADVGEIMKAARRSATLTQQLLAFSRKQVLSPRVLQLNDVVNGVAPMLRRLLGESIDLRSVLNGQGRVQVDAHQIEQVMVNLVLNARDAMPEGGRLTIETKDVTVREASGDEHLGVRPGRYAVVSVADTGIGMDAETRSQVFEPFFTTKGVGLGTGLGLASAYGVVEQSGGHISLTSEVGQGTTFTIYLPRMEYAAGHDGDSELTTPSAAVRGGNETILLLEDETGIREFSSRVLQRLGYEVYAHSDPSQAIAFAADRSRVIDLILSDVVLPGMNGPAMVDCIRKDRPGAKVLFISGYTSDTIGHRLSPASGEWFLPKPFGGLELARAVREALDVAVEKAVQA